MRRLCGGSEEAVRVGWDGVGWGQLSSLRPTKDTNLLVKFLVVVLISLQLLQELLEILMATSKKALQGACLDGRFKGAVHNR